MIDINKLENEFEQIIRYHVEANILHARTEYRVKSFVKYLLDQTHTTADKLKALISHHNYKTYAEANKYTVWPQLEIWRGTDDYGSSVGIPMEDGDIDWLSEGQHVILNQREDGIPSNEERRAVYQTLKNLTIDQKLFPISTWPYYEYLFSETSLFYSWIGYIWQEIEGWECGLKIYTIENNSIAMFLLNDFLRQDFSSINTNNLETAPKYYGRYFQRDLSLIELFLRANQNGYPFSPYRNYWRYFEKDSLYYEMCFYNFKIGFRQGAKYAQSKDEFYKISEFSSTKDALIEITKQTNTLLFDGWSEKLRPLDRDMKFDDTSFEYSLWTGIYWKEGKRSDPEITIERLKSFENKFNIKLPASYFYFILHLNAQLLNGYLNNFPINRFDTVEIKEFYDFKKLLQVTVKSIKFDINNLWIGDLCDGKLLGIVINFEHKHYGHIVIAENGIVEVQENNFEEFIKFGQASPSQPELIAAQLNDLEFLKQRILSGWDVNTIYNGYNSAIQEATLYNSHEAIEFLLGHGAKMKDQFHRDRPHFYDSKTMEILDKYCKNWG
jgi:hypothetical protein